MAATVKQMREGLATRLKTIDDLQVSAWVLASPTLPSAHVVPSRVDFHKAFQNGLSIYNFTVQVFVTGLDEAAQQRLDEYLAVTGDRSIKQAIEGTTGPQTLSGVVQDVIVTEVSSYNRVVLPENREVFSADLTVQVYT